MLFSTAPLSTMTVSDSRVFLDTNILYYANDPSASFGAQAIFRINELATANNELVISSQVIREYTKVTLQNAIYQKLDLSSSIATVLHNIASFQRDFELIYDGPDILQNWMILLPYITTGKEVFDFNIAATLQAAGISYLLTHNMSDFSKFSSWLTVLPLFP